MIICGYYTVGLWIRRQEGMNVYQQPETVIALATCTDPLSARTVSDERSLRGRSFVILNDTACCFFIDDEQSTDFVRELAFVRTPQLIKEVRRRVTRYLPASIITFRPSSDIFLACKHGL